MGKNLLLRAEDSGPADSRAQQNLDEEHRRSLVIDYMRNAVVVYEAVDDGEDFHIVDINKASEQIEQVEREHVIGRSVLEVFPGVRDFGIFDVFQRVWRTGQSERFPAAIYSDDRISGWRDNHVYRLPDGRVVAIYEDVTEQMTAEIALRESNARYRAVVEQAADSILLIDDHGRCSDANEQACTMLGRTRQELPGMAIVDLVAQQDREKTQRQIERLHTGEALVAQQRLERHDGKLLPVEMSARKIEDGTTIAIFRDLSRRKRDKQRIAHLNAMLQAIRLVGRILTHEKDHRELIRQSCETLVTTRRFDHAWLGFLRDDGLIEAVSAGLDKPTLFTRDNASRWLHLDCVAQAMVSCDVIILPQHCHRRVECPLAREVGGRARLIARLEHADQVRGFLAVSADSQAVFDPDEQALFGEVAEDIAYALHSLEQAAHLERTARALGESEKLYRTLVETSPDGIVLIDLDGLVVAANRQACVALGHQNDTTLVGQSIFDHIERTDRDRALQEFNRAIADSRAGPDELVFTRRDGSLFVGQATSAALQDEDGRPAGLVMIVRDITAHKVLQKQFHDAQRMEAIGRLAGGIAHDFNNILTVIQGMSSFVERRLDNRDPTHDDIAEIQRAADRARHLTRQLLTFSRRQVVQPSILMLNQVTLDLEKLMHRLIGEDIELRLDLSENLGAVRADRGHIEQVLMNLAVNARDAMPEGGRLTIRTSNATLGRMFTDSHMGVEPGEYVLLTVEDTGVGMNAEVRDHVFEPFFTTKEEGKGTGLGLSTVYGIIRQAGGSIWVDSSVGGGTVFNIYLPRERSATPSANGPAATISKQVDSILRDRTVLLVEDDELVRNAALRMLHRSGLEVLEAPSPGDALLISEQYNGGIDLVLSDVVMPKMSGVELARRLREARPELRVVLMSGYSHDAIEKHGAIFDGTPLLEKPFTIESLLQTIRQSLSTPL